MTQSSILLAGATGNTGREAIRTLSKLLDGKDIRIIALTRSLESEVVKELSKLPGVEFEAFDWTDVDSDWVKERNVTRAFIAPQNGGSQFNDEGTFHLALLNAGVEYVVRTATGINLMYPSCPIWYGRGHWAVEQLLRSPEFRDLAFTSLCPNTFSSTYLSTAVDWVKEYKKTGKQTPLEMILDANAPVAMINPDDVGKVAAHLLVLDDFSQHRDRSYVLAGPEDVTGNDIVRLVEASIGTKVDSVSFRDTSLFDNLESKGIIPPKFVKALKNGMTGLWDGSSGHGKVTNSEEIMKLAPPQSRISDAFAASLA